MEHAYTRARELCQQVGERPEIVPVLYGLSRFCFRRAQFHRVREIGDTLLRLAQRDDVHTYAVVAHLALGITSFCCGVLLAARQHLEAGIARYTPEQHHAPLFHIGHDPGVNCPVPGRRSPSGYRGTRSKPCSPPRGPTTSAHTLSYIPLVWRMRSVGRPWSISCAV